MKKKYIGNTNSAVNSEPVLTSIDPYEFAHIRREDFVGKYGKAAEELLAKERAKVIEELLPYLPSVQYEIDGTPVREESNLKLLRILNNQKKQI